MFEAPLKSNGNLDGSGGHYYTFAAVRFNNQKIWVRFNDERVEQVSESTMMQEARGMVKKNGRNGNFVGAKMVFYQKVHRTKNEDDEGFTYRLDGEGYVMPTALCENVAFEDAEVMRALNMPIPSRAEGNGTAHSKRLDPKKSEVSTATKTEERGAPKTE